MGMFGKLDALNKEQQQPKKALEQPSPATPLQHKEPLKVAKKESRKEVSKEVKKFTSKLVNVPNDPAVNKVGFYFTRREIDQLDDLFRKIKPLLRDRYNIKATKNEIIRACLAIGLRDWEENQLTSELVNLLTSK
jgi:hypothetical protein